MSKVIHGADIYNYPEKLIDFSSNINPLGIPGSAKDLLVGEWEHLERYPDNQYTRLRESLAKYHQLKSEQVIVGNGAAEIIFLVGRYFAEQKILIPMPTFGEYQAAVELNRGNIEIVYLKRETNFTLPLNEIMDKIDQVDGVILCHPNNPTGKLIKREALLEIISQTRKCKKTLILDEAFIDFCRDSVKATGVNWVNEHPSILIIRAFTKYYGMPGLRLGYGLGSQELVQKLREVQIPWSVNSLAQQIGEKVLHDHDYHLRSQLWIEQERKYLLAKLRGLPQIKVFDTDTNFILCQIKKKNFSAAELKSRMIKNGILIRDASSFQGLDSSYFRVAIKEREKNEKLIMALKKSSSQL